jgi:hypothetical protein
MGCIDFFADEGYMGRRFSMVPPFLLSLDTL